MKSKKRVLIIASSNMSLSGVPVVYMSIVRALKDEYSFDIIILKNDDMYFEQEFKSYGGKIYFFNCQKPNGTFKSLIWAIFKLKRKTKAFFNEQIDINNYDCIHSFNGEFGSIVFSKLKNKKTIKIFHICSAQSAYKRKKKLKELIWESIFSPVCKYADHILFVSKASLENSGYKSKGLILYNIYDEEKYGKIEKCIHNSLCLTQIGTFSSRKNQLFSLRVLHEILNFYPDAKLNIVGKEIEDGYLKLIKLYIKNNNLNDNVNICDPSTDRIQLNRMTSFVIYPSLQDSFGLVLIESQASGIHCFASNTIPNDADLGNVDFIELDENKWSKLICDFYRRHGNARIAPINLEKFSKNTFKNTLLALYEGVS